MLKNVVGRYLNRRIKRRREYLGMRGSIPNEIETPVVCVYRVLYVKPAYVSNG